MGKNGRRSGQGTVVVSGSSLVAVTASSNIADMPVTPDPTAGNLGSGGTKLASITDAFALYRFRKLVIEIPPVQQGTTAGIDNLGYSPEITTAPPTTASAVCDLPVVGPFASINNVMPLKMVIPQKMLSATGVPWFRTREGTYDNNLCIQGVVFFRTRGATDIISVLCHWTIELKDPIGTGQTPEQSRRREADTFSASTSSGPINRLTRHETVESEWASAGCSPPSVGAAGPPPFRSQRPGTRLG